jgi:transaldolase
LFRFVAMETVTLESVTLEALRVKLFADGADKAGMLEMYANPYIKGFTTNPTLMRKAGISDYLGFAQEILEHIPDRPLSLEVFSDDFAEMELQALKLARLSDTVYVKLPITNTRGESALPLVRRLAERGVKTNVTAVMTRKQIEESHEALKNGPACYLSVFAGRIADSGIDPVPLMRETVQQISGSSNIELIWASPRELLNVVQAHNVGCHIITATNDILKKLPLLGKDLGQFSLETVQMFRSDAVQAGFSLPLNDDLPMAGNQ